MGKRPIRWAKPAASAMVKSPALSEYPSIRSRKALQALAVRAASGRKAVAVTPVIQPCRAA